mgnify:CR=1 FL=1
MTTDQKEKRNDTPISAKKVEIYSTGFFETGKSI